jgi:response regulator RpfG family c-di-GMP phosphodiesterase
VNSQDKSTPMTILFLEDRSENIEQMRSHRDDLCDNLIIVSSTAQALSLSGLLPISVIVSAVHLENESVFDFLRAVKNDARLAEVPFIFLCLQPSRFTKSINDSLKVSARALGADSYVLMESWEPGLLQAHIDSTFEKKARVSQLPQRPRKTDGFHTSSIVQFPKSESQA